MITATTSSSSLQDAVRSRAREIQTFMLEIMASLQAGAADEQTTELMLRPYREWLEKTLAADLPLAHALDVSDFLVHIQGADASQPAPRVTVVAGVLKHVREGYQGIARQLAEFAGSAKRFPADLELGLAAVAPGSIYLGFALEADPAPNDAPVLPGMRTLMAAAREALRTLGTVTEAVADGADLDGVASVVADPGVRDAALLAVEQLAPSGRGASRIGLTTVGEDRSRSREVSLTTVSRKLVRTMVANPVRGRNNEDHRGVVREIDLDRRRFHLRRLGPEGLELNLRCVYSDRFDTLAHGGLLNQNVQVTGMVERTADDKPCLMLVSDVLTDGDGPPPVQGSLPGV